MFRLRFTPDFARQKEFLVAENTVPAVPLPLPVQESLSNFARLDSSADAVQTRHGRLLTAGVLWLDSIRSVQPIVIKAALISLFSSACAACSALAAMQILKTGQDLRSMLVLCADDFSMNCMAQISIFNSGDCDAGWASAWSRISSA